MRLWIGAALLAAVVFIALHVFRSRRPDEPRLRVDDLELMPAGESKARAERTLPSTGSEDKSGLLERPEARDSPSEPEEKRDYGPDVEMEWVVDIALPENRIITTGEIDRAFADDWRAEAGRATFYGYSPDEHRWTYLHAAGVPSRWTAIAVARDLVATYRDPPEVESEASLASFLASVRERAEPLRPRAVAPREPLETAAARAQLFYQIWKSSSAYALIVLEAEGPVDRPFAGEDVWDVMYSLGLRWGDMDLFHWDNRGAPGDDYLFDVSTTTPPGYFIPEAIAAGEVHVQDLVFGFSIPRSAAPSHVYKQMLRAATYAQERLGGRLLDAKGSPLDEARAIAEIEDAVSRLARSGIVPGSDVALRLF